MEQVNLKIKGLYTAPNDFSGVPDGALDVADDISIDYENLAESRRGFNALTYALPNTNDRATRFTNYQSKILAHYTGTTLAYYASGSGWIPYSGTYSHPDSSLARLRFVEANKNLYFSTSTGIKKLDSYTGTVSAAGVPKGLDLQLALTGASGFLTTNVAATTTGTTTNGSANLTLLSDITGISVGNYVSGTGVTAGTTVSSITASATVLSGTASTTAGSTSMTSVSPTTGIVAGQLITGSGIPSGTRVSAIVATTVTLSAAATATATGVAVTFSSDPIVTMSANASASGSVTLTFSSGSQIAYRGLFGIKDANNNVISGAPSQFSSITNTNGATTNVQVTMTIPSGITTSHFFQLYRSSQTAGATVSPVDDMQLVYEGNPNSTDLSNGYVQVTDSAPDSLRGAYLYTSTSQEGISQSNYQPPYCKDFCSFKNFMLFANVKTKQRIRLTILAVGASSGVQSGDTLVISGVTFTADSSETIGTGHFKVYTTGTPAQNISDTANSLIRVINRYATNTAVYATLLSGPTDLPGQLLIEEKSIGGSSFALTANAHGSAYSPALPTSGTTVSSAQEVYKNGIIASKEGQPESAPEANLYFAGSASDEILRVIPLREYVVILSQGGIFRFTGSSISTFSVTPFDYTTKLVAPDSAVSLSNEVWGFFDQGVCSVSDTGVNVKSTPIQATLRALLATALSTVQSIAFGVGYETDRKYILALPATTGDTACQQEYVFNTFTSAWVRWTRVCTAGFINKTEDKLYLGHGSNNTISVERKNDDYTDTADESFACTISSSSSYDVTLVSVTGITEGDLLYQDSTHFSVITDITVSTNVVTVQDLLSWSNASATILPAIQSVIQWKPIVAGNAIFVRQYSEGALAFKNSRFITATISFYSDQSQSFEDTPITGVAIGRWGLFPWGTVPWGGVNRGRPYRFLVPANKQLCSQLTPKFTIRNAYSFWKLEGIGTFYKDVSVQVA